MAEFDPLALGAEPVAPTSTFDPVALGAEPVTPTKEFDPVAMGAEPVAAHKEYETKNKVMGDLITPEEMKAIATKHGLPDSSVLDSYVELMGGETKDTFGNPVRMAKSVGGFLGQSFGANLPQLAIIESQDSEEVKAALYELRALADAKKGYSAVGAELAGTVAGSVALSGAVSGAVGATSKAAKAYEAGAVVLGSAVSGYAGATQENAVEEGLIGAAIGAATLGVLKGGSALLARKGAKGAAEVAQKGAELEPKLAQQIDEVVAQSDEANSMSERIISHGDMDALTDVTKLEKWATSPEEMAKVADSYMAKLTPDMRKELLTELDELSISPIDANKFIAQRKVESDVIDFASNVAGYEIRNAKDAAKALDKVVQQEGVEQLGVLYQNYRRVAAADELVAKGMAAAVPEEADTLKRIYDGVKDARYVYNSIDRRLGTNSASLIDELSLANNRYTRALADTAPELSKLVKETYSSKLSNESLYQILDNPASPLIAQLDGPQKQVVDKWRAFFETVRLDANERGLPIKQFLNDQGQLAYVPHKAVRGTELVDRLTTVLSSIEKTHGVDLLKAIPTTSDKFKAIVADDNYKQLAEVVRYLRGIPSETSETGKRLNVQDIQEAVRQVMSGKPLLRDRVTSASAAFAREVEEVPALIRETDVGKLAASWMMNTNKHIEYRAALSQLKNIRDIAASAGDKRAAEYIQKHISDIVAPQGRETLNTAMQAAKTKAYIAFTKQAAKGGKVGKAMANLLSDNNNMLGTLMSQVYPGYLGFSLRSALQNLTQPLLVTFPEIGYRYGTKNVLLGLMDLVTNSARGQNMLKRLEERSLIQAQWTGDLQEVLNSSLKKSWIGKVGGETLEKYNNVAMGMYSMAEKANRLWITAISDRIAEDMIVSRGASTGAKRFLLGMDEGPRRALQSALAKGDDAAVEPLLAKYMLGKTAFDYNRAAMSEFGRAAGPIFSVFSKWPTSIAGDILDNYEAKGIAQGSRKVFLKYMMPFLTLTAANNLLVSEGVYDTQEPGPARALIGKQGLGQASPFGALKAIVEGDLLAPPAISAVGGVVGAGTELTKGALQGELAAGKAVKELDGLWGFVPFGGLLRTFNDVMMLGGEELGRTPGEVLQKQGVLE